MIGKTLGIGAFAKVKLAVHVATGHEVAIKILNREKIKTMGVEVKGIFIIKILKYIYKHISHIYICDLFR